MQGFFKQTKIYEFMSQQFGDWFPLLPAYQTFNYRLNNLTESWQVMVFELCGAINKRADGYFEEDCLIDSMPIMLAVRGRSDQAKVATEIAAQSYCASKDIWYHGVKLHLLARNNIKVCRSRRC